MPTLCSSNLPPFNYILLLVVYRIITFLSRSKRNGSKTSASIFSFLFEKIKEEIRSHPHVEIMRWLINWWLSTFFCWEKSGKFLKNMVQRSICISQTVLSMQHLRECFGDESIIDKRLFFYFQNSSP